MLVIPKPLQMETESLPHHKRLPTLGFIIFPNGLCGVDFTSVSLDNEFYGHVSQMLCLRVCLLMEIKSYESHIRIRILSKFAKFDWCFPRFIENFVVCLVQEFYIV